MIFTNKTIKSKLVTSYLVIFIVTLFLTLSILSGFIYFKKTNVTIELATKVSKIMAENLEASLSFDDKKSAKAILYSLQNDATIEAALLYDKDGKFFSSYVNSIKLNDAKMKLKLLQNGLQYHDFDNIIVASNISLDYEVIGKLVLVYNTDDIKNTLKQILLILSLIAFFILLIMLKISSLLQKRFTTPIYLLVDTMRDILEDNNYTKTIDAKSDDEFQTVFDGFNTMLQTIEKDKIALEALANTDPLTKLFNRRHFYELVNQFLNMSEREERKSSVFMMDIDKFKNVNDTYGHDVGDLVIQGLTKVISKSVRKGDIYARFGGEEFILFLPYANCESAMVIAQKIREATEAYEGVEGVKFTISIGVCEFLDNDLESAIKKADTALYRAKENGRNRVECYPKQ